MKIDSQYSENFETRHIGPDSQQTQLMLKAIGVESIDELIEQTIPSNIRLKSPLNLPKPKSEYEFLQDFRKLASRNKVYKTYIGNYFTSLDMVGATLTVMALDDETKPLLDLETRCTMLL